MEGRDSIKAVQMALLTFYAQTGVGILRLPYELANDVGHDGWISLSLSGLLFCVLGVIIVLLLKRYGNKDIYQINEMMYGSFIGKCFSALMVGYLILYSVSGASLFSFFIKITLLQTTPSWILSPFITLPSLYLVWQGLKAMSRFLYISILNYVGIFIFAALVFNQVQPSFLMPIGEVGIAPILYGAKSTFYAFTGVELIAFFYPLITDKENILKYNTLGILASTTFYLVFTIITIGIFGENLLKILSMPFYNLSRVYNAPIFERIDLYLIAIWFIPMACAMRCYLFAAYDGIQKVFKIKRTRLTYSLFFLLLLVLSNVPKNINQVIKLVDITTQVCSIIWLFFILCLPISFILRKGVISGEKA